MASLEDPQALVGQIEQVRGRSLPSLFSWDERTLAHSSPTIVIPWTLDSVSVTPGSALLVWPACRACFGGWARATSLVALEWSATMSAPACTELEKTSPFLSLLMPALGDDVMCL